MNSQQEDVECSLEVDFKRLFIKGAHIEADKMCMAARFLVFFFQNFCDYGQNKELFADKLFWSIGISSSKKCAATCEGCQNFSMKSSQIFLNASPKALHRIIYTFFPTSMPFFVEIISAYKRFDAFWFLKINYEMYSVEDAMFLTEEGLLNEIFSAIPAEFLADLLPSYKAFLFWLFELSEDADFVHHRKFFHKNCCRNVFLSRSSLIKNQSYGANEKSLDEFIVNELLNQKMEGKYNELYQAYINLVQRATVS